MILDIFVINGDNFIKKSDNLRHFFTIQTNILCVLPVKSKGFTGLSLQTKTRNVLSKGSKD
jgi:hypothetical protein